MHQLTKRLFGLGLLALAATQLLPTAAQACIKFDRAAELALIDDAIASPKTKLWDKAVLNALRKEMAFLLEKKNPESEDLIAYHWLATDALKRIGQRRIMATGKPKLDIGVFKTNKLPELAQQTSDAIPIRC